MKVKVRHAEKCGSRYGRIFILVQMAPDDMVHIRSTLITDANAEGVQAEEHANANFDRLTARQPGNFPYWWNPDKLPDREVVRVRDTWFVFSKNAGLIYIYKH